MHRIDIQINEIADFNKKCMQGIWLTVAFSFFSVFLALPCEVYKEKAERKCMTKLESKENTLEISMHL